jgi:hypothetical protein
MKVIDMKRSGPRAIDSDKKPHRAPISCMISGFTIRTSENQRLTARKRANKHPSRP